MTHQRRIKVERSLRPSPNGGFQAISKIRLQGDWLKQIFPPNTYVRVTLIESRHGTGIALEPLAEESPMT